MSPADEIDPDVVQAIADLTPIVLALRRLSASLAREPESSRYAPAIERQVREMTDRIAARAKRIPMMPDALLRVVNDALDNKARRGRGAPTRPSSRTLLRSLTEAQQHLAAMEVDEAAAKARTASARRGVEAAAEACRAWGAAPLEVPA